MSTWINEETGRREYATAILFTDEEWARREAVAAQYHGRSTPKPAGSVLCTFCWGEGFTQEDHGYDHGRGVVQCHRCGGTGLKE